MKWTPCTRPGGGRALQASCLCLGVALVEQHKSTSMNFIVSVHMMYTDHEHEHELESDRLPTPDANVESDCMGMGTYLLFTRHVTSCDIVCSS